MKLSPLEPIGELAALQAQYNDSWKERSIQKTRAYVHTFGSKEGQAVLADLLLQAGWRNGVENLNFYGEDTHASIAFREGQREIVRHILRILLKTNNKEG